MYGAIIGDLAGSIYEYEQTKLVKKIKLEKIIDEKLFYSDDTILTIAILDAILNDRDYDKYLKYYIKKYSSYTPNYTPFIHFNTTCEETIGNCLYALYNSNSFEDAIISIVSVGGDTDTNACIVGSMAEALYGLVMI